MPFKEYYHSNGFDIRSLKIGFREYLRKMKKLKQFNTFLYRHFKNNGRSPIKFQFNQLKI